MFYPELLQIRNYKMFANIIDEIDTYFAFLPLRQKDKISASTVSVQLGIDYSIVESLLEACCGLGILYKQFAIRCPECGGTLKITDSDNLVSDISSIKDCYMCDEENITVTKEDIYILYKLVKGPSNSPDKIKKHADELFDNNGPLSSGTTIKKQIEDNIINPNDLFYRPKPNEKKKLKELFAGLKSNFKNTTDQGNSLNDLAIYLLNLVKCFTASKVIHTPTNQFDCTVANKLCLRPSILEDIGSFFIVECKHEDEKPGNTYYHKIMNILRLNHMKFGMIFSMKEITKPCVIIAHENYLNSEILVISISYDDLNRIVNDDINFLEIVASKVLQVKTNLTTDLDKTGLFNM